jgi:putative endonuclease
MKFFCYILYSKSINRYYVGYTTDIKERIQLHNNGYFGGRSYTHKASDWEKFLLIPCETISEAILIESKIKRMKSRKYIENLKKYPEMIEKILNELE